MYGGPHIAGLPALFNEPGDRGEMRRHPSLMVDRNVAGTPPIQAYVTAHLELPWTVFIPGHPVQTTLKLQMNMAAGLVSLELSGR